MTLSVTFLLLSSGIHLKNIEFDSFLISKLYIKWDEKLNIHVKEIKIFDKETKRNSGVSKEKIFKHLNKLTLLPLITESIIIENIKYHNTLSSFIYNDKDGGSIDVDSKDLKIHSKIYTGKRYIKIDIEKFQHLDKKINIDGKIILDSKLKKIYLNSKVDISDVLSINIDASSDAKRLDYAISSNKSIPSTSYIVSIIDGIDPRVVYWIDDAIDMDGLNIKQAYGFVEYDKPEEALTNFYAYGVADKLKYTYDQKLDSVKTKYTDLFFKDGILFILPNSSKSYDFDLDASWLRIDFTKPKEILTLHLLFDGMVDQNLKNLLERYKIKLPFIQKSGRMDTNFIMAVNLISLDIDAEGEFYTDKAMFNYLGLDLDLSDTYVKLHNFDVDIPQMQTRYKDIAEAKVSAKLDLKNGDGNINFDFNKINFDDTFILNTSDSDLHVEYLVSSDQDKIKIEHSKWKLNKQDIIIETLEVPFDLKKLKATIPTTEIVFRDAVTSYVSGELDLKGQKFDVEVDLLKLKYGSVELAQSNAEFRALFKDDRLMLSSKDPINISAGEQNIRFKDLDLVYQKNSLHARGESLEVKNLLKTDFNLSYSLKDKDGYFRFNNLNFQNDTLGKLFKKNNNIDFNIKSTQDQFIANASSLNVSAFITQEQWVIAFNSIDKLKKYSPFLNKYKIDKGTFSIYKRKDEKHIKFIANIDYRYKLLFVDEKPISKYKIKGKIDEHGDAEISINNSVSVDVFSGLVGISGEKIGININQIIKLIKDIDQEKQKPSESYISASFKDSYIFLSDQRRIITDEIELQYLDKIITAQIKHGNGEAGLKYSDKVFHLYGSTFNDLFMENIFAMSEFKGGSLDFSIDGTIDKFEGVVLIKDTTIKKFRLLNNVLAFINTIPSLVTFSLPSYDTQGLYAKSAYMRFSYKDSIYNITDISLRSDELDILGKGETSIKNDVIDMELNLKTDLASAASKIPVVGYILFDKNSISTTVKVDGNLSDPNINSMLAKEIVVAPLNIIKRTLLLPFSIFSDEK